MGKKKATRQKDDGKTRLEIRFDNEVYEGIRALADDAGISVNQLLQGMARWGITNAHVGEPTWNQYAVLEIKKTPGCIFFGRKAKSHSIADQESFLHHTGEELGEWETKGEVYFALDFTERRVVVD